jgi:uncharacterized protein (TIGR02996 family)
VQRRDEPRELIPLFDAVAARPGDDAPRQVLADALLERGDLRGEFISIQLLDARGGATKAQQARAEELRRLHARRWLIELSGVDAPRATFHRGFPTRVTLTPNTGEPNASPTWRLVQEIELRPGIHPPAELESPMLERLTTVHGVDRLAIDRLLAGPERPWLREVSVTGPAVGWQGEVLRLSRFPALNTLTLAPQPWVHHAERLSWLFDAPLVKQVKRVVFAVDPPWDVYGLHGVLIDRTLRGLELEVRARGLALVFTVGSMRVELDDAAALKRNAQSLRNMAPKFCPFPYAELSVHVGERGATLDEKKSLGALFTRHG